MTQDEAIGHLRDYGEERANERNGLRKFAPNSEGSAAPPVTPEFRSV
jgi:hypothetical protein